MDRTGLRYIHHRLFHGLDGKKWTPFGTREMGMPISEKVKEGVFAESTVPGTFKAEFD